MSFRSPRFTFLVLLAGILAIPATVRADTVGSPQPVSGSVQLLGISCPAVTTCVTVGRGPAAGAAALVSSGTPAPAISVEGTTYLNAVACVSTNNCYAVGQTPTQAIVVPLTVNGSSLSSGAVLSAIGGNGFNGIACPTTTTCYAVSGDGVLFLFTVNGSLITAGPHMTVPNSPTNPPLLTSIACPTSSTCYTAGQGDNGGVIYTLTVSSSSVSSSSPAYANDTPGFSGISCISATLCYAVGDALTNPDQGTVSAINSGAPGTAVSVPDTSILFAIACPASGFCEAVGSTGNPPNVQGREVDIAVSGTTVTPGTASPVATSYLEGIACPTKSSCEVAGAVSGGGTGVVLSVTPSPTAAAIARFSVRHVHGSLTFHWQVATGRGLAGFRLYAAGHRLSGMVSVHPSRAYAYRTRSAASGPYRLQVVFTDGRQENVTAGL